MLSKNFSLAEFTKSQTAENLDIDNTPTADQVDAAVLLAENVLQPVRDHFGPTIITSGFRSVELNKEVGGSNKSQHCYGEAADIEVPGVSTYDLGKWIEKNCEFDQLILEFYTSGVLNSGWVHVSYIKSNRKESMTASEVDRKTVYTPGLIK